MSRFQSDLQLGKVQSGPSLAKGGMPFTPQEMPMKRPVCQC